MSERARGDASPVSPVPRVSIGLPVYNGERFVGDAIASLLAQTFTDFELLIADNASTDGTLAICRDFAARDPRIRILTSDANRGAAWNFNRIPPEARGLYFKWAAADDMCAPDYLARCVAVLDRDPEVVLCHARTARIDADGAVIGDYHWDMALDDPRPDRRFADLILVRHNCVIVFGVIRRDVLERTPLIGSYVGSDRVLIAELGLIGRLHEVREELFLRRSHEDNSVRLDERTERLAWFNPQLAGRISLPYWRYLSELSRAVGRATLSSLEKLQCRRAVVRLSWQRRQIMQRDLVVATKLVLERSPVGRWLLDQVRRFRDRN